MAKKVFQGLAPWKPWVVLQEAVAHALLAWFAISTGIGYLGLMLVFAAELFLGNLVSAGLYPERGLRRHAWDLVKFVLAMAFLGLFVFGTHGAALQGSEHASANLASRLPAGTLETLRWSLLFAVLSIVVRYLLARREPDPRLAWARTVLVQNAATFVTMLLMIFVAAFAGAALTGVSQFFGAPSPVEAGLVLVTAAMRLFFALLVSRMPENEMRDIAHRPYVD